MSAFCGICILVDVGYSQECDAVLDRGAGQQFRHPDWQLMSVSAARQSGRILKNELH